MHIEPGFAARETAAHLLVTGVGRDVLRLGRVVELLLRAQRGRHVCRMPGSGYRAEAETRAGSGTQLLLGFGFGGHHGCLPRLPCGRRSRLHLCLGLESGRGSALGLDRTAAPPAGKGQEEKGIELGERCWRQENPIGDAICFPV